jgi:stage V sporulation protein R
MPNAFRDRFQRLPGAVEAKPQEPHRRAPVPPHPERDLLWFIASYAPELEQWERDIFLAVREESFYFYPVFACQIMNEGWASYWHARLLREADFLPQDLYLSAIKSHSDVVRPFAAEQQIALQVNPYHLGFSMWEHVVEEHGLDKALEIRKEEDDFSFVRNWLDDGLAEKLGLFVYQAKENAEIKVAERDIHALRETLLAPKFNYGAPRVAVAETKVDGSLELEHDHATDGRGLDTDTASRVLGYVERVWRRPVRLKTVDSDGDTQTITAPQARK